MPNNKNIKIETKRQNNSIGEDDGAKRARRGVRGEEKGKYKKSRVIIHVTPG